MRDRPKVLVGYDGSTGARDAVALAVPLARLWETGIHVLTVHPPVMIGGETTSAQHELRAARTAAEGARLVEGTVACRSSETVAVSPAKGLHDLARAATRCVVVGRPQSRPRLGASVPRRVLHGCPVAVAVPRRDLVPRPLFDDIVLAVDASLAELADPRAAQQAAGSGHRSLEGQLDQLIAFAQGMTPASSTKIRLCALVEPLEEPTGVPDRIARAALYAGERLNVDVEVMVCAVAELCDRFDSTEIIVHVGEAFGAHGYLQPGPTDLHLLHDRGPSLLVLPPPSVSGR